MAGRLSGSYFGGSVAVCVDAEQSDATIHQMLKLADTEAAFVSATYLSIVSPVIPAGNLFCLSAGKKQNTENFAQLCEQGRKFLEKKQEGLLLSLNRIRWRL